MRDKLIASLLSRLVIVTVCPQLASRFPTRSGRIVTCNLSEVRAALLYVYIACTPPAPPLFCSLEFSSLAIQSTYAFQVSRIGIRDSDEAIYNVARLRKLVTNAKFSIWKACRKDSIMTRILNYRKKRVQEVGSLYRGR
jgi:hypothetical protein